MSEAARAVIGCCLTRRQLFQTKRVKAFDHDFPEDWTVDPKTGKKLWEDDEICILMPEETDFSMVEPRDEIGGLYLFHDRSGWGERDTRYLIGGLALEDDNEGGRRVDNFQPIDLTNIHAVSEAVRKVLEPHGLWDEEKFGLWVVQYRAC